MRLLTSIIGFAMVVAFAGNASADEQVKLQLRIEPAANNAELSQLMRQNTVRVALQRHRLWQEAAQRELDREAKQLREEKQAREQKKVQNRHRNRTGEAAGTPSVPQTGDDVAVEGSGEGTGQGDGAGQGEGDQVREQHRYQNQNQNQKKLGKQGEEGKGTGAMDQTRLRNMLHEERVSGGEGDALEQKLQQRLREHKRQMEKAGSGEQHQYRKGSGNGSGSGQRKRSGR